MRFVSWQLFMGMSVAGIVFDGYFFAFHLLNIVNNNQLLRGVIQAVTQNGQFYVASSRRIVRSVIITRISKGTVFDQLQIEIILCSAF